MFNRSIISMIVLACFISACGASGSNNSAEDPTPNITPASLGTKVNLTYNFQIQLAEGKTIHDPYVFPKEYTVPLYVQDNGSVSLRARDFPKMVLRICPTGTPRTDCDVTITSDDQDLGTGLDMVMDLCGINNPHSGCGSADGTIFSGKLIDDGSLSISGIAVRVRIFHLNEGPNGNTALATSSGFIADLPRITATVQTTDIITSTLKAYGEKILGKDISLTAGGVIPANMPELGDSSYVVTMEGSFDQEPLPLLNKAD